jgi:hypothetical protein
VKIDGTQCGTPGAKEGNRCVDAQGLVVTDR